MWDGSPSRWPSTEEYCASCLIDVNEAAGRKEKVQSHCKLPVRDPGSKEYNKEAVYAAAGGHGITQVVKPDDVPQEEWDKAIKKAARELIEAYKSFGEEPPESVVKLARTISVSEVFSKLVNALNESYGDKFPWVNDIYFDDEEDKSFAIVTMSGKLYMIPFVFDGNVLTLKDPVEIDEAHAPATVRVVRQANGENRWFAIASTSVVNRVGEIDSRELFDSFVENAKEKGYPELLFFHDKRLRLGKADFLAREGNVYIASGTFYDNEISKALIDAISNGRGTWGCSIGYEVLEPPRTETFGDGNVKVNIRVYTKGVNREISIAPENRVASWFTGVEADMNKALEDALIQLFGDETKAREFISKIDKINRQIEEERLIVRANFDDEISKIKERLSVIEEKLNVLEVLRNDMPRYRPREFYSKPTPMTLAEQSEAILRRER